MSDNINDDPRIIGYNSVRRAVGTLGLALPVGLYLYGLTITDNKPTSISQFYHTAAGDILVGTLCAIGIFLIAYRGYPRDGKYFGDNWVAIAAGVSAIGVALFPTPYNYGNICSDADCPITGFNFYTEDLHIVSTCVFFACLAIFCLVLFPKGTRDENSRGSKQIENATYYASGVVLLVAIAGLIYLWIFQDTQGPLFGVENPVFVLEFFGIIAFSVSWLTKGKTIAGIKSLLPTGNST